MKNFIFGLVVICFSAESQAGIFCKLGSQVVSTSDEIGWECRDHLLISESKDGVCFTGPRSLAIKELNSLHGLGFFDGTDGEYIQNAKYRGKDSIIYTIVDEANDWKSRGTIERCTGSFFR